MCRTSNRPVVQYNGAAAEQVLKDIEIEVRRLIIEYQRRTLTPPPWETYDFPAQPCAAAQDDDAAICRRTEDHPERNIADLLADDPVEPSGDAAAAAVDERSAPSQRPETPQRALTRRELRAERKATKRYYRSLAFQVRCNIAPLEDLLEYLHEMRG